MLDNIVSLVLCGQVGVLSRFWLHHGCAGPWKGSILCSPFDDLPANMLGCFIMGLLCDGNTSARLMRCSVADVEPTSAARVEIDYIKKMPLTLMPGLESGTMPTLLLGLRTGFCGSLTTFSSWNAAMARLLVVGDIGDAIAGYLIGLMLSCACYRAGQQVGLYWSLLWSKLMPTGPNGSCEVRLAACCHNYSVLARATCVLLLLGTFAGEAAAFILSSTPSQLSTNLLLALFFAPLGVILRWWLSSFNGKCSRTFCLGTFAANMLACAVSAAVEVIDIRYTDAWTQDVTSGISIGFAGSLSTVSTFIAEVLDKLESIRVPAKGLDSWRRSGAFYAAVTIVVGAVLSLAISGWASWTS